MYLCRSIQARRRELQAVIRDAKASAAARRTASIAAASLPAARKTGLRSHAPRQLKIVIGYTILVFDTNVMLKSLSTFSRLLESRRWTLVLPLVTITELDGLSANQNELGRAAAAAVQYLETSSRTHSMYLKVQTSRGNYLSGLTIRKEEIDFATTNANSMDDIVLRAATWQSEHFVNRLNLLDLSAATPASDASKVALVTFDRNLRLKAHARGLDALDEEALARLPNG